MKAELLLPVNQLCTRSSSSWAASPQVLASLRPTVAIKSHHSGVPCSLTHLQRLSVSQANSLHNEGAFQHLSLQSIQCMSSPQKRPCVCSHLLHARPPCCVAAWLSTELTVLAGFDQSCDKTHLPPRKQNLRELQQRILIQTVLTAK